jgi:hypothetical protein
MDYDEFTTRALQSKLEERRLPVTGIKIELIARLQDDDRRKANHTLFSGAFKDSGMYYGVLKRLSLGSKV